MKKDLLRKFSLLMIVLGKCSSPDILYPTINLNFIGILFMTYIKTLNLLVLFSNHFDEHNPKLNFILNLIKKKVEKKNIKQGKLLLLKDYYE